MANRPKDRFYQPILSGVKKKMKNPGIVEMPASPIAAANPFGRHDPKMA